MPIGFREYQLIGLGSTFEAAEAATILQIIARHAQPAGDLTIAVGGRKVKINWHGKDAGVLIVEARDVP